MFITYVHCIFIFIYIHVSLPYRESTLYIATCNISRSSFTQPICLFFCVYPSSMLPMWDVLKNSQAWGLENSSRCEAIFALEYNDILRLNFTRGFCYVKIFCCQIKDCNCSIISKLFKTIETKKIYNEKLRFWNIFDSQHFKELFFTEINLNFRIYCT